MGSYGKASQATEKLKVRFRVRRTELGRSWAGVKVKAALALTVSGRC